jgi:hypothetical protein
VGERRDASKFLWGNLGEEYHWEDRSIDGRIILRWIIRKWDGARIGLIWLRIGTYGGLF